MIYIVAIIKMKKFFGIMPNVRNYVVELYHLITTKVAIFDRLPIFLLYSLQTLTQNLPYDLN